jgi:hypothetical protein
VKTTRHPVREHDWFDKVPISDTDRQQIGRGNAERLFNLPA